MSEFLKILVLDDDSFVRSSLTELLSERYRLLLLGSYLEFKSRVNEYNPHILFLSLKLADSSGIEICRSLRRAGKYDNMMIIIITDSYDSGIIEEGYAAGADDFIRKPFIPFEVTAKTSIFERIIRGRMNLESAFKDQLGYNRKLYKLEEIIKRGLSARSASFDYNAVETLHDIIPFGYFEIVRHDDGGFSPVAQKCFDDNGYLPLAVLQEGGLLKSKIDPKGRSFRIQKKSEMIYLYILPLVQAGRAFGYALFESAAEFKEDDRKIMGLFMDYIGVMNERFSIERMLKNKNSEYKAEISKIRKLQVSLLPDFKNIIGYDIASSYLPAADLSGDFFDGFFMSDDVYQLIICDISGHGMASAYVGNQIRTIFRNASAADRSPSDVVKAISDSMLGDLKDMAYYGTVILCQIHLKEGKIKYLNAGHPPALYFSRNSGVRKLPQTGPLVGLFDDNEYAYTEMVMEEGDCLFMYTDGITEASPMHDRNKYEMYGEERLVSNFKKAQDLSSRNIIHSILGSVYEFIDYRDQEDDMTAICIRKDSSVGGIVMF